jgi:hypothetical protein
MYKIILLGAISTFFSRVSGYGSKIHVHLGELTDSYLKKFEPILYHKVMELFDGQSISSISSWADKVKRTPEYNWTKELHFIDILECNKEKYTKDTIDKYCNNHCIVSALQDFTNSIKYNFKYDYIVNEDTKLTNVELLKFLIHFTQDFSQPMHLLGYDRGGNSFKVNVFIDGRNRTSNLHFIWDSMLPEYFVDNYVYTFANKKIIRPDNYYNLLDGVLNDNIRISCRIYPDSHYIIFNDYFNEDYFLQLFDNYQILVIGTLKYIFEV